MKNGYLKGRELGEVRRLAWASKGLTGTGLQGLREPGGHGLWYAIPGACQWSLPPELREGSLADGNWVHKVISNDFCLSHSSVAVKRKLLNGACLQFQ